jgi:hypothetical protein
MAFKNGLLEGGDVWMAMIKARNQSSQSYNLQLAEEIVDDILTLFYPAFEKMAQKFKKLSEQNDE